MSIKKIYVALSAGCLVAAVTDSGWRRFIWAAFAFAFIFGADAIKDVEKAKRKERDLTEIRMKKEMLDTFEVSLDGRYDLFVNAITNTSDTLLKQLATYVRTGVPDRTCEKCEKESQ